MGIHTERLRVITLIGRPDCFFWRSAFTMNEPRFPTPATAKVLKVEDIVWLALELESDKYVVVDGQSRRNQSAL